MMNSLNNLKHIELHHDPTLRDFLMDELDEQLTFKSTVWFQIRDDTLWISIPSSLSQSTSLVMPPDDRTYVFYEKINRILLLDLQDDTFNIFQMSIIDGEHHFYRCSSSSLKLEFFNLIRSLTRYYSVHDQDTRNLLTTDLTLFQWVESLAFYEQRVFELFEGMNQRASHIEQLVNNIKDLSENYESIRDYLEPYDNMIEKKNSQRVDLNNRRTHLDTKIGRFNEMIQQMTLDSTCKDDIIGILRTKLMKLREAETSRLIFYWKQAFKGRSCNELALFVYE